MPDKKKGTATASCSYLWRFECSVCGHEWTMDAGSIWDTTAYDPYEDEELVCEKCDALLTVTITE